VAESSISAWGIGDLPSKGDEALVLKEQLDVEGPKIVTCDDVLSRDLSGNRNADPRSF
jgi:hypothetical protein